MASVKKPKKEKVESTEVTNVQMHIVKDAKMGTPTIHSTAFPYKNDSPILDNITKIQKSKNWIKRILSYRRSK